MGRSGQQSAIAVLIVASLGAIVSLGACQSDGELPTTELGEEMPVELQSDTAAEEWLPIVDQEPLGPGDVRHLKNCAEYSFEPPVRGPWDSHSSKVMAADASPLHRTTDRVVTVGERPIVEAQMKYDKGPLSREWVRMFIGTCDGWSQQGVQKTSEDGHVSFRLKDRPPAGVYGVVFQAVGDQSMTRGQLWIISDKTEVVAIELDGGAFDHRADDPDQIVEGAPELSRRHASHGRLVVYVQSDDDSDTSPQKRREKLREHGFSVGPIIDATSYSEYKTDLEPTPPDGWGESTPQTASEPAIKLDVSRLYTRDAEAAARLKNAGLEASRETHLEQLQSEHAAENIDGWHLLFDDSQKEERR